MEDYIATPSETMETTDAETTETFESAPADDVTAEETQVQTEKQPFNFELQYNKEKVIIDSEEKLRELAQKGMNYEKVYTRTNELQTQLQQMQGNPLLKWANEYMQSVGYNDPNEFLQALEIQNKVSELVENQGFTEAQARRIAEAEAKAAKVEERFNALESKDKQNKDYIDFIDWHKSMQDKGVFGEPLDFEKIPVEVWQAADKGTPLKYAYMEAMLPTLRVNTEQEVIKNLQKNANTSPGSVKDSTVQDDVPWTAEYIEQMADKYGQSWVLKNFEKIEKSGYYK